eukprot:12446321-Alexandrium_andersonii.AAC.1
MCIRDSSADPAGLAEGPCQPLLDVHVALQGDALRGVNAHGQARQAPEKRPPGAPTRAGPRGR